ncbi:MAG: DNA polymerase III subunit beta [Ignavibacteria bacterium]|nr:DNA polymerase III subunit beta [Ignavibacteria bacterium]
MKFNISAEKIFNAVNKLNYVVPGSSHSTLPLLSNIYFSLEGNTLRLIATDLEAFLKTDIEVEGLENGAVAVPARKFLDLLKALIVKTESVIVKEKIDREGYGKLVNTDLVPDLGQFGVKVDGDNIQYKGYIPEDSFSGLEDVLKEYRDKTAEKKDDELTELFSAFADSLRKTADAAVKTFKKATEKIKIKIESNDKNKITISSKNGKYQFFGEPVEDYPVPEDKDELSKLEISGTVLRKYLQKVKHSVKNDEIRRNMAGVFFDTRKTELRLVATDGFRLSKISSEEFSHSNGKDENFILPVKTVDLLVRLITDAKLIAEFDSTIIKFTIDNLFMYSKLIDDTFPNYEAVIPKDNDKKIIVSRHELISSLRRASIFTDKVTNKVKFDIVNGELTIKADNPESGGEGEETINCEFKTTAGDTIDELFTIAFNVNYMLDCLSQMDTDDVIITFSTPSKATIAIPVGSQEDFMELIMPVRVG